MLTILQKFIIDACAFESPAPASSLTNIKSNVIIARDSNMIIKTTLFFVNYIFVSKVSYVNSRVITHQIAIYIVIAIK